MSIKTVVTAPIHAVKNGLDTYSDILERSRFHYGALFPSPSLTLVVVLALFTPLFFHLFMPLWLFFLMVPYLITWSMYLVLAQHKNPNRPKILGIALPALPLSPTRVFNVTHSFFRYITDNVYGPPREVFQLYVKNLWGAKLKLTQSHVKVGKNVTYGSRNEKMKLDVYESKIEEMDHVSHISNNDEKRPVILFIYGGAWNSGSKDLYAPVALSLTGLGFVVVIPDYSHWPNATPELMVDDVQAAMAWTLKNIKKYGGDSRNVTVLAHASGAHLCTTAILKNAKLCADYHSKEMENGTDSDDIARNPNAPRLHRILGLILISGVYDINTHYEFEKLRGTEELSCMSRLFESNSTSYNKWSPTALLREYGKSMDLKLLLPHIPHNWLLIHGHRDEIAPFESSVNFEAELQSIGIDNLQLKTYEESCHSKLIYDLFLPNRHEMYRVLEQYYKDSRDLSRYQRWVAIEKKKKNARIASFHQFQYQHSDIAAAREEPLGR
ncbi:Alpha/Beta hydrolase protein [Globomyces pollinis-pini]|nr:Alpha/Beta hydrolase protein [Globomyces pollinis-pini]